MGKKEKNPKKKLTKGQMSQLLELDKGGDGIREELQRFIVGLQTKLADEKKVDTEWARQAKALYDRGFGRALGFESFEEYLMSIPPDNIPDAARTPGGQNPSGYVMILVDSRLPTVAAGVLAGIAIGISEMEIDDRTTKYSMPKPYWALCRLDLTAEDGVEGAMTIEATCAMIVRPEMFAAATANRRRVILSHTAHIDNEHLRAALDLGQFPRLCWKEPKVQQDLTLFVIR